MHAVSMEKTRFGRTTTLSSSDWHWRISLIEYLSDEMNLDSCIIRVQYFNVYGLTASLCSRTYHGRLARMLAAMFRRKYLQVSKSCQMFSVQSRSSH